MAEASSSASASRALISVQYGVHNEALPVTGKTVAQIRRELGGTDGWGVPADAKAFNNKVQLSDDHIMQPGESLNFSKRAGEKG